MSLNKDLRVKYKVRTHGISGLVTGGQTQIVEYKLVKNMWFSAIRIILKNHADNDTVKLSAVDKDFLFVGTLYPATPSEAGIPEVSGLSWQQVTPNGVHLDDFGDMIQVMTDRQDQGKEEAGYWAKLLIGMYIEIKYKSTGVDDVLVKANLFLHEEK